MFDPKGKDVSIIIDSDELAWRHATSTQDLEYFISKDPYTLFGIKIPTVFTHKDLPSIRNEVNNHNGTSYTQAKILEELTPEVRVLYKSNAHSVANSLINNYLEPVVSNVRYHRVSYVIEYCDSYHTTNLRSTIAPLIPYKQHRGVVQYDITKSRNLILRSIVDAGYKLPRYRDGSWVDVGVETDDIVADLVYRSHYIDGTYPVVIGRDKDFLQLPNTTIIRAGYKGATVSTEYLNKDEALHNLLLQWLIGDTADNIKGAPGVGHRAAVKTLEAVIREDDPVPLIVTIIEGAYVEACHKKAKKLGLHYSTSDIDTFALNLCYDTFFCLWLYDCSNVEFPELRVSALPLTEKRKLIEAFLIGRYHQ